MTATVSAVPKSVPFKSIFIPDDRYRQGELPEIPEMGEDLKLRGQLEPIVVEKGGPDGFDYTLAVGGRRCAGFIHNRWQNREILVTVRTYPKDDPLGPIFDDYASNEKTHGTNPLDRALLCHQLVTGTHPRAPGLEMDRKEVEKRLGLQDTYLGKMLKLHRDIDPKVAKKARTADASLRVLLMIAAIKGVGDDADAKAEDRAEKQMEFLDLWLEQKKTLKEEGRLRAKPATEPAKKPKKAKPEPEEAPEEVRARVVGAKPLDAKKRSGAEYLRALMLKVATATREDALRLQGAIDATKFFTGETKTMKGLTEADFKAVEKADMAAAPDAGGEEEETEEAGDAGEE